MDMKKPGVVIFSTNYYSNEVLAAAHWASDAFPKLCLEDDSVRFLLVEEDGGDTRFEDRGNDGELMRLEQLSRMVQFEDKEFSQTVDNCIKNKFIRQQVVVFTFCYGAKIQDILQEAIRKFELDTLVIGMGALGSACKNSVDLQLNSKCSVVLVNIEGGSKPLEKTTEEPSAKAGKQKAVKKGPRKMTTFTIIPPSARGTDMIKMEGRPKGSCN